MFVCVVCGEDFLRDGKTIATECRCVPKAPPVLMGFYDAHFTVAEVLCKVPLCNLNLPLQRILVFSAFA